MCSHYQMLKERDKFEKFHLQRGLPLPPGWDNEDVWPGYGGLFIRRPPEWDSGDEAVPEREAIMGRWGLISSQTSRDYLPKAEKLSTFNARAETAAKAFTFKHAWAKGQRCLIPAEAIFEPDWRSGKSVPTRFTRVDGTPLGIAGLWDRYRNSGGEWVDTYTMLTINADAHPLFRHYHRPGKEKRMVVILPPEAYEAWLTAPVDCTADFFRQIPAKTLEAKVTPTKTKKRANPAINEN